MARPRICASLVSSDLKALPRIEPLVDLYEVRIDLIGTGWEGVVSSLNKPWIATNRLPSEGGKAEEAEEKRLETLLLAAELGAGIIDIELRTPNLGAIVPEIKKKAECLISYHDFSGTPRLDILKEIVEREITAGADICKVVTTANNFENNVAILQLIKEFPRTRLVALTMGELGMVSRVMCPLVGGDFTYASISKGKEAAPGQMTVMELRKLYVIANE